ncbi:MAG: hypothetical protein ACRDIC_09090 [bacterium]
MELAPYLVSLLLSIVGAEVASRAFWSMRYHVPFAHPDRILYAFYPELERIDRKNPRPDDGFYDILLLGGSALHRDYGEVEQALQEQLAYAGHRNVRVYNLADRAHTSRDSRLKYAAVGDARFDLVLVYDGINEARANNAPPEIYRDDYAHYAWYEVVNTLAPYHRSAQFALPYTLRYLQVGLRHAVAPDRYAPTEAPRPEWRQYGRNYRSVMSLEHNLNIVLRIAARHGDRVMLMTYATYVPDDYTPEAFQEKRLAYGLHLIPIELWGRREDVMGAVAAQNAVVRGLAERHRDVLFVDQATLMAGSPLYFNDACHLTVAGSSKFVENLLPHLLPLLPRR